MSHSAALSAPARRPRRIVLASLAISGGATATRVAHRPLVASAPSSSSAEAGRSTSRQTALDEGDGVTPHEVAVSVFDLDADPTADPRMQP